MYKTKEEILSIFCITDGTYRTMKSLYVSLLFPKLKKSVTEVDILELPHEKDKEMLPSNDDGVAESFFSIKVKDYLVPSKKTVKCIIENKR